MSRYMCSVKTLVTNKLSRQTMNSTIRRLCLTSRALSRTPLLRCLSSYPHSYSFINVETHGTENNVGLISFNRPKVLNALSDGLISELLDALNGFDKKGTIGAIVLTGSEKLFTAGADITEMSDQTFSQIFPSRFPTKWDRISDISKPLIAAVNGFAFGGGCEISLMCDIIYAGENAKFGLPEVRIGTCPGAGGTQRLPRAIGKSLAMEAILTGQPITAQEAFRRGMVSKLFPANQLVPEAIKLGEKISENSKLIAAVCKASVNNAYETTLTQGLQSERRHSNSTFITKDRQEGMKAFVEKRKAKFTDS